jgi:hypothetical protein
MKATGVATEVDVDGKYSSKTPEPDDMPGTNEADIVGKGKMAAPAAAPAAASAARKKTNKPRSTPASKARDALKEQMTNDPTAAIVVGPHGIYLSDMPLEVARARLNLSDTNVALCGMPEGVTGQTPVPGPFTNCSPYVVNLYTLPGDISGSEDGEVGEGSSKRKKSS